MGNRKDNGPRGAHQGNGKTVGGHYRVKTQKIGRIRRRYTKIIIIGTTAKICTSLIEILGKEEFGLIYGCPLNNYKIFLHHY